MPWRTVPVQCKAQRGPAGLRAQFFLTHIVAPATAGFTDTTTHHQHIDDAAIVHIHVVPVVQTGAQNDHRTAFGFFRIQCEFTGNRFDLFGRNAGDLFGPCGGVGNVFGVIVRGPFATQTAIQTIAGAEQVEHGGNDDFLLARLDALDRNIVGQNIGVVAFDKVVGRLTTKVGEVHFGHIIVVFFLNEGQLQFGVLALGALFQVPFAIFTPAETDGAVGHNQRIGFAVPGNGFPFGVILLAQFALQVIRPQEPARNIFAVFFFQTDQHREIRIFAGVVLEIRGLTVQMEFTQDNVAHGHRQRTVCARFGVQPDITEFCSFGIVRADHGGFGAFIADLGIEVRIGRTGLRHVTAPEQQVTGVIPVSRFRHVGLFTPCHRRCWRKVTIPVIERHHGAAQQAEITGASGIGYHRHRRDRRETEDAVWAVCFGGVGVGGPDDFVGLFPCGANEAALTTGFDVRRTQDRIILKGLPRSSCAHGGAQFAVGAQHLATDQRGFHAVGGIQIPAVGGATLATTRFVVGHIGAGARVIGLLGFPGHDTGFDIDFPRT